MPGTDFAAVLMSAASLNAMGQNGLVGMNSTVTVPGSVSFTLWIICISSNVCPVSGSSTLPTSWRTLSSNSVIFLPSVLLKEI